MDKYKQTVSLNSTNYPRSYQISGAGRKNPDSQPLGPNHRSYLDLQTASEVWVGRGLEVTWCPALEKWLDKMRRLDAWAIYLNLRLMINTTFCICVKITFLDSPAISVLRKKPTHQSGVL